MIPSPQRGTSSPLLARDAVAGSGRYPDCRYQATVRASPVGRSVGAAKPSSLSALETSYIRLCVEELEPAARHR